MIGTGDLESFAAQTFDAEAAIGVGEMEQNGALRDLERAQCWALVAGRLSLVLGQRARRRLLCAERRKRE